MSHFPHDEFAKTLLVSLLEPLGHVAREREIPGEALSADISFDGLDPSLTQEDIDSLGLLGKILARPCLLEPYRSPLRTHHVTTAMSKVLWLNLDRRRKAKLSRTYTPPPWIWILSPRASPSLLQNLRISPMEPSEDKGFPPTGAGIYTMGPRWRLAVISIQDLTPDPDTLLIRLLGRGQTQLGAAQEVSALDPTHPRRKALLDLMAKWRIFLEALPPQRREEEEVLMFLRTAAIQAFDQQLEQRRLDGLSQGLSQGRAEAAREFVLRSWSRRFGAAPPSLEARLETIGSMSSLEAMLDEVLAGNDREETLTQLLKLST